MVGVIAFEETGAADDIKEAGLVGVIAEVIGDVAHGNGGLPQVADHVAGQTAAAVLAPYSPTGRHLAVGGDNHVLGICLVVPGRGVDDGQRDNGRVKHIGVDVVGPGEDAHVVHLLNDFGGLFDAPEQTIQAGLLHLAGHLEGIFLEVPDVGGPDQLVDLRALSPSVTEGFEQAGFAGVLAVALGHGDVSAGIEEDIADLPWIAELAFLRIPDGRRRSRARPGG